MRAGFIRALMDLAKTDERIFLLVGDVGYSLVEPFAQGFPRRFINVGIAEQNMMGIATGLAMSGKIVFAYSLANFPTFRCVEQIRNDVCYHNANVKIVASGGGLVYGALGVTHHVTEDLAIMRALPNMTVIAPGDPIEAALATREAAEFPGPCYLRLARTGDPVVHEAVPDFQIGKAITVRNGDDITLVASGGILYNTVQAAKQLEQKGIKPRVLSMHTVKPLDAEALLAAATETKAIITIEEHSIIGGLGGAVAEVLAESGISGIAFRRVGIKDCFCFEVGSQAYLCKYYSLSAEDIVNEAIHLLKGV
ncbi:MAG: transketolase [Chloroflexi bacterium]|nr:transketolase [Chloroflexota bacterium]MBI3930970.1 transketolase [Chloroflexota bacterium]